MLGKRQKSLLSSSKRLIVLILLLSPCFTLFFPEQVYAKGKSVSNVQNPKQIPPKLTETTTLYIYETTYGRYSFLKSNPLLMSYQGGSFNIAQALPYVLTSKVLLPTIVSTPTRSDSTFMFDATFTFNKQEMITLKVSIGFFSDKSPKITWKATKTAKWDLGDFQVVWFIPTNLQWAKSSGQASKQIAPTVLGKYGNTTHIALGSKSLVFGDSYLSIDWSDYGIAECYLGTVDLSFVKATGVLIKFPKNVAVIDPTVATSTSVSSLLWGGMTKAHYDSVNALYVQAYYSGADATWYLEMSDDGTTWTNTPQSLSTPSLRTVSFACKDNIVHYVYGDVASRSDDGSLTVHMHYRRATINSATSITLGTERTIQTWTQSCDLSGNNAYSFILDIRYYDVSVGTDNLITVVWARNGYAYAWYHTIETDDYLYASRYVYNVIKSTATDGSTWGSITAKESANSYWTDDTTTVIGSEAGSTLYWATDTRPRLAPLASAVMICFDNKDEVGRYSKSSAWTTHTNFDAAIKDVNAWGSVAGGNGGGKVGLTFLDSDDDLEVCWYDGTTLTTDNNVQVGTFLSPSMTSNNVSDGAWYLLFISSTSVQYLKCTLYDGTWDANPTNLATSLTSPVDLSSSRTVLNNKVLFSYQTGSSSPYTVNFDTLSLSQTYDRTVTQSVTQAATPSRMAVFTRSSSQSLSFSLSAVRIALFSRAPSQTISMLAESLRFALFSRAGTQEITLTPIASRIYYASRIVQEGVTLAVQAVREASFFRAASQSLSFSLEAISNMLFPREAQLSVSVTLEAVRNMVFPREAQLSVSVTPIASRILYASREIQQGVTLAVQTLRETSIFRSISQLFTFSFDALGNRIVSQEAQLTLSVTPIASRVLYASREIQQGVTLAVQAVREASFFRSISQALSFSIESIVGRFFPKEAQLSMSVTPVASRVFYASRQINQGIELTISALRTAIFNRLAEQQFALVAAPTKSALYSALAEVTYTLASTPERFMLALRATSQTINLSIDPSRLAIFQRTAEGAFTLSSQASTFQIWVYEILQSITLSSQPIQTLYAFRDAITSIGLAASPTRLLTKIREVAQTITISLEASGLSTFLRTASQQITLSIDPSRVFYAFRTISQQISTQWLASSILNSVIEINVNQLITVSSDLTRTLFAFRDGTLNIGLAASPTKLLTKIREISQTITYQHAYTIPYPNGFTYRKSHTINGQSGAGTDYQIRFIVNYGSGTDSGENVYLAGKCRTDFADIRFEDSNGNLLSYWRETYTAGSTATFWVKITPTLDTEKTIYLYYGKSDATTTSNGDDTFLFFDDFEAGNFNKWTTNNGWSIATDQKAQGTYSAKGGDGHESDLRKDIVVSGTGTMLHVWARQGSNNNFGLYAQLLRTQSSTYFYSMTMITSYMKINYYKYDVGAYTDWPQNSGFSYNTWYRLEGGYKFSPSDSKAKGWKSGSYMGEIPIRDQLNQNMQSLSQIRFYTMSNNYAWLDVVYLRKYVDPEPAHGSWGTEEVTTTPVGRTFYGYRTVSQPLSFILVGAITWDRVVSQAITLTLETVKMAAKFTSLQIGWTGQVLRTVMFERTVGITVSPIVASVRIVTREIQQAIYYMIELSSVFQIVRVLNEGLGVSASLVTHSTLTRVLIEALKIRDTLNGIVRSSYIIPPIATNIIQKTTGLELDVIGLWGSIIMILIMIVMVAMILKRRRDIEQRTVIYVEQ